MRWKRLKLTAMESHWLPVSRVGSAEVDVTNSGKNMFPCISVFICGTRVLIPSHDSNSKEFCIGPNGITGTMSVKENLERLLLILFSPFPHFFLPSFGCDALLLPAPGEAHFLLMRLFHSPIALETWGLSNDNTAGWAPFQMAHTSLAESVEAAPNPLPKRLLQSWGLAEIKSKSSLK